MSARFIAFLLLAFFLLSTRAVWAKASGKEPIIIAHRGASGYRPEHTLAAYELAINLGADFIEPDLVSTKDGVLVARHENEISGTSDVAEHKEFAGRFKTKLVDGETLKGWFTEDFTLAELKTLRAKERIPEIRQRNTIYNGFYEIPTLEEILDLVKRKNTELKKGIGIYPELKHPIYFESVHLPLEERLLAILKKYDYGSKSSPVFIQCFEPDTLKKLRKLTDLKLVQLIDESGQPYCFKLRKDPRTCADMLKPEGLKEIATYADGIGPNKNSIFPRDDKGKLRKPTTLVADAHKVGLLVHPWTFRNENKFLPSELRCGKPDEPCAAGYYGDAVEEYKLFFEQGVDGVFSESPDTALLARDSRR